MIELSRVKRIVDQPETADRLRKYKYIMGAVFSTEVSADYTFQEAYCEFYPVREYYSKEFLNKFFFLMEKIKKENDPEFRIALETLADPNSRNLMTAASLLLHSVNPRFPVWDKMAAKEFFDMEEPEGEEDLFEKYCKQYERFSDAFYVYRNSPEGNAIVRIFDEKFPNAEISDVVKLDLIAWQYLTEKGD